MRRPAARKCSFEGKCQLQRVSIAELTLAQNPSERATFPQLLIRSLQQDHIRLQI